ncbi:MAG: threonine synthase [Planctomycetes bacterium]|nr:threonine synthase [Planctomycetota bacterium]
MTMAGIIERYRDRLPVTSETPVVSLEEGSTPLIHAPGLSSILGDDHQVFLKFEGLNPTGSFKDRGMTLAVSKAMEDECRGVICASTGNTSASAAAYAARAGVPCWVVLPAGKVAAGKLAQAIVHGAHVIPIDGNFDEALKMVVEISEREGITLVNSLNPYRLEGQKTIAFEIVDQLGTTPDAHFLPVGNAGNITATWRGYRELQEAGDTQTSPRMIGCQAAGSAPIVEGAPVEHPETIATAIRIGNPASWQGALDAIEQSSGDILAVEDEQILAAYQHLAQREGVFCEPASAASVAGLLKQHEAGVKIATAGSTIVCTLTGHGLKDPDRATAGVELPTPIPTDMDALRKAMDLP